MNIIKLGLLACFATTNLISINAQNKLTSHVNPLMGTSNHGHTFPGATLPFGMVQLSPDNGRSDWDWVSGYSYDSDYINGFSHLHLSGTGIGDWLDIALMPMLQPVYKNVVDTRTFFSHKNEEAKPGYYKVTLDNGISAQLTASERVGYSKFSFPKGSVQPTVRLDLHHAYNWDQPLKTEIKILNDSTIVGTRISKGWAAHQRVFFALRTSKPFAKILLNGETSSAKIISSGKGILGVNAQLVFPSSEEVSVKVALSTTNTDKAVLALNEISTWNFDQTKALADQAWDKELNKINIDTKNKKTKDLFYSMLYRTAISPMLYSDADGEYGNYKDKVLKTPTGEQLYSVYSLWDTFRAQNPLLGITQPERYLSMMNSMLQFYDQYGLLPVWDLSTNETNTMTGYHAVPVLADAILKELPGLDVEKAYKAMLASANQKVREVPAYIKYGYVPQDIGGGSVTKTLEYAFDDYAISLVAKKLGKQEDYELFTKRAKNYQNLFDPQTGFMRAKYTNGKFVEPFDPFYSEHDFDKSQYIEGTAWQHTFFVPHDVRGFAKLFPKKDGLIKMLDSLWVAPSIMRGQNTSPDAAGFIGQYAAGNEPSHHIAYMYAFLGQQWKSAYRARQILESFYHTGPAGYPGNEDAGQMSAWGIWTMIGMYPEDPVSGQYVFGSPMLDKAEIKMPNGKLFTVIANNVSDQNIYIQSVTLDGKPYDKVYINHAEMLNGGTLTFNMGAEPNYNFGKKSSSWPVSMRN